MNDDRRQVLYGEHLVKPPAYSVHRYIQYLRDYVSGTASSTKASSSAGRSDGKTKPSRKRTGGGRSPDVLNPLSYFLRKLKLDLKTSYANFVSDFIAPPYNGLRLLLTLLRNVHGNCGKGMMSVPRGGGGGGSSGGSMHIEEYKQNMVDELDCLLCIKYTLRIESAMEELTENSSGLHTIGSCCLSHFQKSRIAALEILSLLVTGPSAVDKVLESFTAIRVQYSETTRFKMLLNMLYTRGVDNVIFQISTLRLLNALCNMCRSPNMRVFLQYEMEEAGLDLDLIQQTSQRHGLEYDDLNKQIHEWKTRYIDVSTLLKKIKIDMRRDFNSQAVSDYNYDQQYGNPLETRQIWNHSTAILSPTGGLGFELDGRSNGGWRDNSQRYRDNVANLSRTHPPSQEQVIFYKGQDLYISSRVDHSSYHQILRTQTNHDEILTYPDDHPYHHHNHHHHQQQQQPQQQTYLQQKEQQLLQLHQQPYQQQQQQTHHPIHDQRNQQQMLMQQLQHHHQQKQQQQQQLQRQGKEELMYLSNEQIKAQDEQRKHDFEAAIIKNAQRSISDQSIKSYTGLENSINKTTFNNSNNNSINKTISNSSSNNHSNNNNTSSFHGASAKSTPPLTDPSLSINSHQNTNDNSPIQTPSRLRSLSEHQEEDRRKSAAIPQTRYTTTPFQTHNGFGGNSYRGSCDVSTHPTQIQANDETETETMLFNYDNNWVFRKPTPDEIDNNTNTNTNTNTRRVSNNSNDSKFITANTKNENVSYETNASPIEGERNMPPESIATKSKTKTKTAASAASVSSSTGEIDSGSDQHPSTSSSKHESTQRGRVLKLTREFQARDIFYTRPDSDEEIVHEKKGDDDDDADDDADDDDDDDDDGDGDDGDNDDGDNEDRENDDKPRTRIKTDEAKPSKRSTNPDCSVDYNKGKSGVSLKNKSKTGSCDVGEYKPKTTPQNQDQSKHNNNSQVAASSKTNIVANFVTTTNTSRNSKSNKGSGFPESTDDNITTTTFQTNNEFGGNSHRGNCDISANQNATTAIARHQTPPISSHLHDVIAVKEVPSDYDEEVKTALMELDRALEVHEGGEPMVRGDQSKITKQIDPAKQNSIKCSRTFMAYI